MVLNLRAAIRILKTLLGALNPFGKKEQMWLFGLTGDADLCAVAAALLSDNL